MCLDGIDRVGYPLFLANAVRQCVQLLRIRSLRPYLAIVHRNKIRNSLRELAEETVDPPSVSQIFLMLCSLLVQKAQLQTTSEFLECSLIAK